MNAQYYDLNVWSSYHNKLTLSAYEWELSSEGDIQQNSSKYYSITFTAPKDMKEIEFLLDDLYLNQYPLTDYDEWRDLDELLTKKTPEAIFDFLDSLPMYDVPIVGAING
jgi:hypothetical protein